MAPKRSASHRLILPCVLIWLFHFEATFSIPEGIQKAAQAQRISPENFLENVSGNAGAYQESNRIAGRVDFMNSLKKAARWSFLIWVGLLSVCLNGRGDTTHDVA